MRTRDVALVVLVQLSSGAFAYAQQTAPSPDASGEDLQALRLFEEGMRMLTEQRFGEAAGVLERSIALREHPAALAALAASYRGAGRYLRAIATLERVLATNVEPAREREVRSVIDECQRALARVQLRAIGSPSDVLINGERVARGDTVREVALDPGVHRFEVRREGFEPREAERTLRVGEHTEVTLDASERAAPTRLTIETPDGNATLRVDGVPVGRGHYAGEVAPGRHALLVTWPDGHTQERVVDLVAGSRMSVSIAPNRSTPITARWWFWAGITAVVVGAAATAWALWPTDAPPNGSWGTISDAIVTW
jgi:hypothetical protein